MDYKNALVKFLDANRSKNDKKTHYSMDPKFLGKFLIEKTNLITFHQLLDKCLENKCKPLSLIEAPKEISPLTFDFDFKFKKIL